MTYQNLTKSHTYIKDLRKAEGDAAADEAVASNTYYHEHGRNWPVYLVKVLPQKLGITVELQVKKRLGEWWGPIDWHRPLPFELSNILILKIQKLLPTKQN